MMWGQHGDDGDNMGWRQQRPQPWGPSGGYGDDVGMTAMMWGRREPHRDNKITKNAITFDQIEIIEFHLKIWNP